MKKCFIVFICLVFTNTLYAHRWQLDADSAITWKADGKAHSDHIEMSGRRVSVVLRYGINEAGNFILNKGMVWPLLRTVPNNTHASLMRRISWNPLEGVIVNGHSLPVGNERVQSISLNGTMDVWSKLDGLEVRRTYTPPPPSVDLPGLVEVYHLKNTGERAVSIEGTASTSSHRSSCTT